MKVAEVKVSRRRRNGRPIGLDFCWGPYPVTSPSHVISWHTKRNFLLGDQKKEKSQRNGRNRSQSEWVGNSLSLTWTCSVLIRLVVFVRCFDFLSPLFNFPIISISNEECVKSKVRTPGRNGSIQCARKSVINNGGAISRRQVTVVAWLRKQGNWLALRVPGGGGEGGGRRRKEKEDEEVARLIWIDGQGQLKNGPRYLFSIDCCKILVISGYRRFRFGLGFSAC